MKMEIVVIRGVMVSANVVPLYISQELLPTKLKTPSTEINSYKFKKKSTEINNGHSTQSIDVHGYDL